MEVVGVTFKPGGQVYYFSPGKYSLKCGVTVVVETDNGLQFGIVSTPSILIDEKKCKYEIKKVVRIATKADYQKNVKNVSDAKNALIMCKEMVESLKLNMYIVDAYFTLTREQLIFRFFADGRIDFRELARELASIYHTRIELRQIGVRDKAREVGGFGTCGERLCCARFLDNFESISIAQAKNQGVALNPTKINGCCGRLKCCLKYEDDVYTDLKKGMPEIGSEKLLKGKKGTVTSVDILNGNYTVTFQDNSEQVVKC